MQPRHLRAPDAMDRLSNLPEPILQRILYFVIDNKESARTCVLSKSWRSIWSNLPKLSLSERTFKGNKKDFIFHANNTLQSLLDQNHQGVAEFHLTISTVNSQSLAFLQTWVPMLTTMSIKHLHLNILPPNYNNNREEDGDGDGVDLPSEAFAAESLQKLHLSRCNLLQDHNNNNNNNNNNIQRFKHHLTTLRLCHVSVKEEDNKSSIVDKIISGCPWLTTMWFEECKGLRNIKVNHEFHKNLRHFTFIRHKSYKDCRIEIDLPTIETIEIRGSVVQFHNREYSKLKSLSLETVRISRDSFDKSSSCSFPILEDLKLRCYYYNNGGLLCIDAPNIVNFEYSGTNIPSIYFNATCGMWRSNITLHNIGLGDDVQSWFRKLSEFLLSLSQSDISTLTIWNPRIPEDPEVALENIIIDIGAVATVGRLALKSGYAPRFPAFLGGLFRICRPRAVAYYWDNSSAENLMGVKQLTAFLRNNLNQQDHFPSQIWFHSFDFGATEQKPLTRVESPLGHISFLLKWRVDNC